MQQPSQKRSPLNLICRALPHPNVWAASWDEVARIFESATLCTLQQSWRKSLHPRFAPAHVRAAWTSDALWLYAELHDEDIWNDATQLNQYTFLLGDAFEIFLHPLPGEEYFELHVTPHDVHLQLHFSLQNYDGEAKAQHDLPDHQWIQDANFFRSRSLIETSEKRWRVLAEIPAHNLTQKNLEAGDEWLFSFSRYDYTRGVEKPVLSSTSSHSRPNFHDRADWGVLKFLD